jgi:hypothetical protein
MIKNRFFNGFGKITTVILAFAAATLVFSGCESPTSSGGSSTPDPVTITGEALVGETLISDISGLGWTGEGISYQWQRGDTAGDTFTDIDGAATFSTYTLTTGDADKYIRVTVSLASASETSAAVGPVGPQRVTAPTANPPAGEIHSGETVTLSTVTSGATIHYTTDGSEPSATSSAYTGAISVPGDVTTFTIKAIAVKESWTNSATLTSAYTVIASDKPFTPVANPPAGDVLSGAQVTLTTRTENATIYYTIDGSTPTYQSTQYTTPIPITANTTIKAIAVLNSQSSGVLEAAYTIDLRPALTGSVSISGTPVVGQTLTAVTTQVVGSGPISYQWQSRASVTGAPVVDIPGAIGVYYIPVTEDVGKYIQVKVSRAGYTGTLTGTTTAQVTVAVPTVSISGTATVGETLTATATNFTGTVSYQWQSSSTEDGTYAAISGATTSTYALVAADATKYIKVIATAGSETAESNILGPVAAATLPPLSGTVSISGTLTIGQTVSAVTTSLTYDTSGTLEYEWKYGDSDSTVNTVISGASTTSGTLSLTGSTPDLTGKYISVTVTATKNSGFVTAVSTAAVKGKAATPTAYPASGISVAPLSTISLSTSTAGATIYYTTDGSTPSSISSSNYGTTGVISIPKDRTEDYIIKAIAVKADLADSEVLTATYEMLAPPTQAVTISGLPAVGSTLTATPLGLTGTLTYQWLIGNSPDGTFVNIADTDKSTYAPKTEGGTDDAGKWIYVKVSDGTDTVSSTPVGPVQAASGGG